MCSKVLRPRSEHSSSLSGGHFSPSSSQTPSAHWHLSESLVIHHPLSLPATSRQGEARQPPRSSRSKPQELLKEANRHTSSQIIPIIHNNTSLANMIMKKANEPGLNGATCLKTNLITCICCQSSLRVPFSALISWNKRVPSRLFVGWSVMHRYDICFRLLI